MSGIEKFRDFVGSGNIDTFVREESGGKVESLGKGFFGRVRPSGDTNRTVTESFRKALVKEYGEHVSQWVFTDYEDRMRNGKPLSGERIQKVINRAEVARQKDLTALRKVLPQIVTPLLETSLKKAGLEAPDMGGNEWRRLMTMVVDEICKNSKSGNSKELGDLSLQVDKFVEDNKSRIEEQLSEPLDLKTLIVEDYQRSPGLVISGQEPRDSLQQIWGYLSQPGNDSGVLILRTNDEGEMTLERKSSSQLSSLDEEQLKQQVHDTHTLLREMLDRIGPDDLIHEFDNLQSQEGVKTPIESSKMLGILNRYMAPDLSQFGEITEIKTLGGGGFGEATLVTVNGDLGVLKRFRDQTQSVRPQKLSLERGGLPNEATASYLTPKSDLEFTKDDPNRYSNRVHVAQPAFYLISVLKDGKREDEMVDPHTMRDRVKQGIETGSEVWCHGIIMPKAGGDEVKELMQNGTLTEPEKKNLINSMLQTIKGLNERGFVHHDIKPDNCYFDKETKTTTLIDTGSLYKTREGREKHGGQYIRDVKVGTPGYWHPRVDRQEEHGTETDLYALGVVALQLDHPTAYSHLVSAISKQMSEPGGVTEDWALKWLEQEIGRTQKEDLKNDLIALRDDLLKEDPKSLSGFAIECFAQAGLPAEDWSGRTYAQKAYSKLLEHSGIQ